MRKLCRLMISRYTLCALIILLDLSLLVYFALNAYRYSVAFFAISVIVTAAILVSLINRDANPAVADVWRALIRAILFAAYVEEGGALCRGAL